ncbi:hypothetical protein [Galbibacter pacificus]|uniref:Uncharacterized protein n=1 Tax=Galbibacter pacificus TaxID=2996052 RepID=A0ABT6FT86_9FLAO|nr:hypothetical protein [Galbibacter pacificus]MDG3583007.1 hypothetical protein [Galbibacter pacificus]MDG3586488.1 hypothetical protein [Galbibacter pacificus]
MKIYRTFLMSTLAMPFLMASCNQSKEAKNQEATTEKDTLKEKTVFQTGSGWMPEIDVRSDVAIVYGVNGNPSDKSKLNSFQNRVKSWREHGYQTHFMTGIAWGSYQDYFLGNWDGKPHFDEGQVEKDGDTIWHGRNVPYIVPTASYLNYFKKEIIKTVIDAGITSIYLEEPEFWARGGYSDAFKREWEKFYGFPWRPQDASPENTWLANKLKYQLYYNAIKEASAYAKAYGKEKGYDNVKIYIPTHSLVNYSSWMIVSPEASLASLPDVNGYIAQVWTGTSREATFYNGKVKERTFENAFLEYGSMVSMTAPTGRKMYFLTDPIEDRRKTWDDYKKNYQATFVAKLLHPSVANYEVMPWPERIYTKPYQVAGTDEKVLIPGHYATQMQIMINALNDIPSSENKVSGNNEIGVLMGNSLMFQRFPTHDGFEDPRFSNFYGQTLPLLKRGIPVQTVHMENLDYEETLKHIKVLVMSYSNMKPTSPKVHKQIAKWVKNGGVLVYVGADNDPYQKVMEWWNQDTYAYEKPSLHLFEQMDIKAPSEGNSYTFGKGFVHLIKENPKEFVLNTDADQHYVDIVKKAYEEEAKAGKIIFKNSFLLSRGYFDVAAVLDESVNAESLTVNGPVIDLFDPELPVLKQKTIKPGAQSLLINLNRVEDKKTPKVLATAARVYNEQVDGNEYRFTCKSPKNTKNAMRILLPKVPEKITVTKVEGAEELKYTSNWDATSHTLLLKFENFPNGVEVQVEW